VTDNVIGLFGRRDFAGDPVAMACQRLAALRHQAGMSPDQFAEVLTDHLGRDITANHIAAWEDAVPPTADVIVVAELVATRQQEDGPPDHVAAMKSFRAADLRAGGTTLYPAVMTYLRANVAPLLVTADGDGTTFAAAAGLTDMAGWMAYDAGDDDTARAHFSRALQFAQMAEDAQVTAHVNASNGHLAQHRGDGQAAVEAASSGLLALALAPAPAGLAARLHATHARGLALLGEPAGALAALDKAEDALGRTDGAALSPWVSTFDEATLASEAARCRSELGQFAEADAYASRVLELRPPGRARSRAFGLLVHARSAAARGDADEAAAIGIAILEEVAGNSSQVISRELAGLGRQLRRHRSREVTGFLDRLSISSPSRPRLVVVKLQ
jgi:tetratricopeptide (TPR) repeat protein